MVFRKDYPKSAKKIKRWPKSCERPCQRRNIKTYRLQGMMKGIHSSIKGIHNEVKDIQKASAGLIDYYAQDRNQGLAEWTKMQDAIAQLRKNCVLSNSRKK